MNDLDISKSGGKLMSEKKGGYVKEKSCRSNLNGSAPIVTDISANAGYGTEKFRKSVRCLRMEQSTANVS